MDRENIVAIIPARGGSKGIPHKNIIDLGGFPLIAYSIAAAKLSKLIDRVIVSTDSQQIANIALQYGAEIPFLRPKNISRDTSTDKEFFLHAIRWFKKYENQIPDLFIHLRPTSPFREIKEIEKAIYKMLQDNDATSLRSVEQNVLRTPFKMLTIKDGYMSFFGKEYFKEKIEYYNLPRQKLPKTYDPNGLVDIIKPKVLLKTGTLHGDKMAALITEAIIDIDSLKDLENAGRLVHSDKYKPLFDYLRNIKCAKL